MMPDQRAWLVSVTGEKKGERRGRTVGLGWPTRLGGLGRGHAAWACGSRSGQRSAASFAREKEMGHRGKQDGAVQIEWKKTFHFSKLFFYFVFKTKSNSNRVSNVLFTQIKMRNFGKFSKNKFLQLLNSFTFKFYFPFFSFVHSHF